MDDRMNSCYYSSFKSIDGRPILEIWYNLGEKDVYNSVDMRVNLANLIKHKYKPIYFRYDLSTGKTTYLVCGAELSSLAALESIQTSRVHPFTIHLTLMAREFDQRRESMMVLLERTRAIEIQLLGDDGLRTEPLHAEILHHTLRELHIVASLFVTGKNRTSHDLSNVKKIIYDLSRLDVKLASDPTCYQLDMDIHYRLKDGMLSIEVSV